MKKTSWAIAISGTCDDTKENQDKFLAIFETAIRASHAMPGHEGHDAGNGQFYGTTFPDGTLYINEREVSEAAPVAARKPA